MATVRYLVNDVDAALAFYVDALGFELGSAGDRRSQWSAATT
jgi:catechol 2,3-dioxygenase-like lactoylglutathione lyase family enzyme